MSSGQGNTRVGGIDYKCLKTSNFTSVLTFTIVNQASRIGPRRDHLVHGRCQLVGGQQRPQRDQARVAQILARREPGGADSLDSTNVKARKLFEPYSVGSVGCAMSEKLWVRFQLFLPSLLPHSKKIYR